MTFDNALKMFRQGVNMTRLDWADAKQSVYLEERIFKKTVRVYADQIKYSTIAYSFSNEDLLAKDWEVTRS